jgi:hypothetical protein
MQQPSVLVTCPDYDTMTRYLSAWADIFINEAEKRGQKIYVLKGTNVNKTKFDGIIKKVVPEVIFINGHGRENAVAGHDHDIIVDSKSVAILNNTTVYALSCKSAQILGVQAVESGAKGYVGYSQDFILVSQPDKIAHPKDDKTAALFLEPSNMIVTAISKGYSTQEAVIKGKAAYAKSILSALNSDVQSDDDKYIPYLMWNRQFLTAC